jgi:TatA/E family protein of Tat protein translocase
VFPSPLRLSSSKGTFRPRRRYSLYLRRFQPPERTHEKALADATLREFSNVVIQAASRLRINSRSDHEEADMLALINDTGIIVLLVAVALLFGASQIPKLARNLGEASKEFRKAQAEMDADRPSAPDNA